MEGQARNRKGESDRTVLEHARALLLVLAALVERAAALPIVERLRFLDVMGHGEADARRLILAMASGRCPASLADLGAPVEAEAPSDVALTPVHYSAGNAALLARRFRMLACAVDAMLALTSPSRCRHAALSISREPRPTSQFTPSPALRATSPPQAWARSRSIDADTFIERGTCAPVAIGAPVARSAAMAIGAPRAGERVFLSPGAACRHALTLLRVSRTFLSKGQANCPLAAIMARPREDTGIHAA